MLSNKNITFWHFADEIKDFRFEHLRFGEEEMNGRYEIQISDRLIIHNSLVFHQYIVNQLLVSIQR